MPDISRILAKFVLFLQSLLVFIHFLYLIRFPTFVLLIFLLGFMPLSFWAFPTLLKGMFDLSSFDVFWLSLAVFLLSWTTMVLIKLNLLYGTQRVSMEENYIVRNNNTSRTHQIVFFATTLMALPLISGVFLIPNESYRIFKFVAAICGFLVAFTLLYIADLLQRLFNSPQDARELNRFLFPFDNWLARKANDKQIIITGMDKFYRQFLKLFTGIGQIPEFFGRGFVNKEKDSILPGHLMALVFLCLSMGVYLLVGYDKGYAPALIYLVLAVMVLCWILSAISFIFDCYRVPTTLALFLLLMSNAFLSPSDHYYDFSSDEEVKKNLEELPSPTAVLNASPQDFAIVVSAQGGGIQAAAWTAKVLTELENQCRQEYKENYQGECSKTIRLISSASGGSVGAMYFVDAFTDSGLPQDLKPIVKNAEKSSLNELAWGLAYPDLQRVFLSSFITCENGRGQELEKAWQTDNDNLRMPLSKWRKSVKEGKRPAVIFNSTIAETGEALRISTTDQSIQDKVKSGAKNFYQLYGRNDISIATAARLSATFPFVTPAARPKSEIENSQYHAVDGGYYDNYGISSLVAWVDEALSSEENKIKKILVVQIYDKPSAQQLNQAKQQTPIADYAALSVEHINKATKEGWFYQLYAPLWTILNVRDTAQASRNDVELNLLRDKWRGKVEIETVSFDYESPTTEKPPLSWHLTKDQKCNIEKAWKKVYKGEDPETGWLNFKKFMDSVKK